MSKELMHLFKAIKDHHLGQVKIAIVHDKSLVNTKDDKGNVSLLVAAEYGNENIIDALVKHGAHINYQLPIKLHTALILAAKAGNFANVDYLLKHGADVNKTDEHGKTALSYAQENKQQKIIDLLEKFVNKF